MHGAIGEGHCLLGSGSQSRRHRATQRAVAETDAAKRQRLVTYVPQRHILRITAAYRHMAVVDCRWRHLHLGRQHGDRACGNIHAERGSRRRREHRLGGRQHNVAGLTAQHHAEGQQGTAGAVIGVEGQAVAVDAQAPFHHRGRQLVAVAAAGKGGTSWDIAKVVTQGDKGLHGCDGDAVGQRQAHGHRVAWMAATACQAQRILCLHRQPHHKTYQYD